MTEPEQLQLDLDYGPPPDHFTIEVRSGLQFNEEVVRTMEADTPEEAVIAIESLRLSYAQRNHVKWEGEEVNAYGSLLGLDDKRATWQIQVNPPLPLS
jgi:hypothetical protein